MGFMILLFSLTSEKHLTLNFLENKKKKLNHYGIIGIALNGSTNRKQCMYLLVKILLNFLNVSCGVLRGSVFGHLLFDINK